MFPSAAAELIVKTTVEKGTFTRETTTIIILLLKGSRRRNPHGIVFILLRLPCH